jgi:UPF0716 protein FxsA
VFWLVLLIAFPIAEIALLVAIGRQIGAPGILGLLFLTGLLGVLLARRQGLEILRRVQSEMAAGQVPASHLVDGAMVLLAGALLIVPGVLTDLLGLFCLLPAGRAVVKSWLRRRFEAGLRSGRISVAVGTGGMRDITPRGRPSATEALGSGDEP